MNNWLDIVVDKSSSIMETMKVIDKEATQFAAVIEKGVLCGTVTDGDVRRGLLKGIGIEDEVQKIMNKNPIYVSDDEEISNKRDILIRNKVRQLPVVNAKRELIDILFWDEIDRAIEKPNKVLLMAGGLGTRLRPLTNEIPKPLLKVGDKPILHTIIDGFKKYGFTDIYLSVNYKSEAIQEYFQDGKQLGVNIKYLDETRRLGTAGAISLLKEQINEPFFVMNGDLLTTVNFAQLLKFHQEHDATATMCVREYEFQIPFGVIKTSDDRLIEIQEKPTHKEFVNAGIYVLNPKVVDLIPYNEFYDMPTLFQDLIKHNMKTSAFPLREYWLDIGRHDDLKRANSDYFDNFI
ncbi:UTP--glucose-1-phosphate uridylyltransferase [Paraliobacillus ryukyuensis]|uniref:Nucleotidyltransferase-like protein n=1 Tax=Paraliobacillus ryukyuensis TaxID=200904 RepID=A0A366EG73_9BACI|nr:nucleotidyltransferase family protein [Paraliobacillus ryukyuensis]RBP00740.1 nucleotidyltransferase-like protein [Paraliobacillus ryukyuensis]